MICFLCSSVISPQNCGVRVSLTKIFTSLEINRNIDKCEKLCCKKCALVSNSFTNLLEDLEKIRLELKIKVGQFGQLINSGHNENLISIGRERQPSNNDDKYLKQMAKQKSLKIFMDQMQPIISLRRLDASILEILKENRQETNIPTDNATLAVNEVIHTEIPNTIEMGLEKPNQQPEHENLNREDTYINNERINKKRFKKPANKHISTSKKNKFVKSTKRKRTMNGKPIKIGPESSNRDFIKKLAASNGHKLRLETELEFLKAGNDFKEHLVTQLRKSQHEYENKRHSPEKGKKTRKFTSMNKKQFVMRKRNENLGNTTKQEQLTKSINKSSFSKNTTVEFTARKRQSKPKRRIMCIASDDEDDVTNPAGYETNNLISHEPAQGETTIVQCDHCDDNFEATSVFAGYDNPSKQERMSYVSSTTY